VQQEVEQAVAFGESSPEPGPELLLTDIYTRAQPDGHDV
jgi:TPP-dependent pyruvate/acetoin dehydrogenase alpha subunit